MLRPASNPLSARRYRVELITAESESSLFVRHRRLIRFPQLTMPLLAAWTPPNWEVSHTDEIVKRVDLDKLVDLVGITANTPAAPHAYALAQEFRRRGVAAVIGGPHATLLPDEVAQHSDAVVVGVGELVWPQLLADFERGELRRVYKSCATIAPPNTARSSAVFTTTASRCRRASCSASIMTTGRFFAPQSSSIVRRGST